MIIYSSGGAAVLAKGDISLQVNKFITTIAVLKTHCVCVHACSVCASACVPVHAVHTHVCVRVCACITFSTHLLIWKIRHACTCVILSVL